MRQAGCLLSCFGRDPFLTSDWFLKQQISSSISAKRKPWLFLDVPLSHGAIDHFRVSYVSLSIRLGQKIKNPFRFIMSVIYNEEGGIFYYICLAGFMISLPFKVLVILFFWYRLLFNLFSANYVAVLSAKFLILKVLEFFEYF